MAIVRKLEPITLEVEAKHTEVNSTYTIIVDQSGEKYLQIDTYGSKKRKIPGKKSLRKLPSRRCIPVVLPHSKMKNKIGVRTNIGSFLKSHSN